MSRYLTAKKLEELKKELEHFRTARRFEVADRLKRAKELGDLSENSEYMEARDEQQFVETHISELENIIKDAQIITMTHGTKAVEIGTTFEAERGGKKCKFTIVGGDEAKPASGMISNDSPIGKAFLGHKQGDTVTIKTPAGEQKYTVTNIE